MGPSRSDPRQAPRHDAVARRITKSAERIAATWGANRKLPQVAFNPDWTKHAEAAPLKANDQMLEWMPVGVVVFLGAVIQDNLADKARKMGIPVYRMATGSA